jgi:hypothetical protein
MSFRNQITSLSASQITPGTLNGSVVETAATGTRIVLNPNDGFGDPQVELWTGQAGEVDPATLSDVGGSLTMYSGNFGYGGAYVNVTAASATQAEDIEMGANGINVYMGGAAGQSIVYTFQQPPSGAAFDTFTLGPHELSVTGWTALPLSNGYTTFGSGWAAPAYRRMPDGTVKLRGIVGIPAGTPTNIATIPAPVAPTQSCRPAAQEIFTVANGNNFHADVNVLPNGSINWNNYSSAPTQWFSLSGIHFSVTS